MELAFTDLADLPTEVGRDLSSRPVPGTPEYQYEQERLEREQWQTHLPKELAEDGWLVCRDWDEGCWQWVVWHAHTFLKTRPFLLRHEAIDQAIRLATFYELLPLKELCRAEIEHPTWFTKLPSLVHWYEYDHLKAWEWAEAYQARHPT